MADHEHEKCRAQGTLICIKVDHGLGLLRHPELTAYAVCYRLSEVVNEKQENLSA